ncbi:MAG TPA: 23S rRNA (guanosine(2251)-2'-O)-methyltransferase RlmB [Myxococcales bacterium]|nr:23S rRNA (guanosine(2251)-2'-O)-methyltransferase RlmB [Myxococcales bacterium]HAN30699.1 23S rRNA (guanosine(2251)-2'-O)-methyltransferase RlmB [Myxococcales bacterium]
MVKRNKSKVRGGNRRHRRHGSKPKADWVIGIHAVQALVEHSPHRIERVHVWRKPSEELEKLLQSSGVKRLDGPPTDFESATHLAQGIAAFVAPFEYEDLDRFRSPQQDALLLVLDGVTDTRNLGSILRSAGFFGVSGVILPKDRSASITALVERIARGGSALTPVARVTNVARSLQQLSKWGWTIVGTALDGADSEIHDRNWSGPICLVLGAEDRGIRPLVRAQCDHLTVVPGSGQVQSLNVASFATVAIWELRRSHREA